MDLAAVVIVVTIPEVVIVAAAADNRNRGMIALVGFLITIKAVVLIAILASVNDAGALILFVTAQAVVVTILARGRTGSCRAVFKLLPAWLPAFASWETGQSNPGFAIALMSFFIGGTQ
ncbi:hypothetical protein EV128_13738 [Rhizobium azibense]|nr:hypothetical protein [Rhizobium gallicum]TDW16370.1 hypothetical protein EV128_13738 [Rhizobium azibense]